MKMLEERHEGMKEGMKEGEKKGKLKGEQRFGKLLSLLIKDNKTAEIAEIATNVRRRNQLFLEYGL